GACVFLGERGCTVHPDRPLACRVYPLARWVSPGGAESFGHLEPHPQTAGVYGSNGTVADWIAAQGLEPYFEMNERFTALYHRMVDVLSRLNEAEDHLRLERREAVNEMTPGALASSFLDVDATVWRYCHDHALEPPADTAGLMDLHIRAIEEWLDRL